MKKTLIAATLLGASTSAMAVAPGGPGCGWGNMLFEGNSGLPMHLLATIVNGTSGNATFGMTTGTNGCDTKRFPDLQRPEPARHDRCDGRSGSGYGHR
ncbi:DUF3015 family protein [Alcanivorax sp.]|uniref:DUF3015 family protein n=1 Tax=Alcanivorax sp. TaxID=1872427 RepID=UPI003BAA20E9